MMRWGMALLITMIAGAGAARADTTEPAEALRLLPPRPGIWEQRGEITTSGPDADHPGATARETCAFEMRLQSSEKLLWGRFLDELPRRFNPMRFTANTPSHAAAYRIETHTGTIAKRLKIEGGAWSSAIDIRRVSDREYLLVSSTTSSRFGTWSYTRRETTRIRWLAEKLPPVDISQIRPMDPFHFSNPCRPVGKPTGRIASQDDGLASALLTPPG